MGYDKLIISNVNDVYIRIDCEPALREELSEFFTFQVPGFQFSPAFKKKKWDGKIRLYNRGNGHIYAGLLPYIALFAKERKYKIIYADDFSAEPFSIKEAAEFIQTLGLPAGLEDRDYQQEILATAVRDKRRLFVSPTGSGKSFAIYTIMRWLEINEDIRTLIICPTTSLVLQMKGDFEDYGWSGDTHVIMEGQEKDTDARVTVSTWQSVYDQDPEWFDQFGCIIGDEAHQFDSKCIGGIMRKATNTVYRFGFTGTIKDTKTHRLMLEGLFGVVKQPVKTKELMDRGVLAPMMIKCIVFKHPAKAAVALRKANYQTEIDYIVGNQERNQFIKNLVYSIEGNSLILFNFVDKHGMILFKMIEDEGLLKERPVFYVDGKVDVKDREEIRKRVEQLDNAIVVASYKTFSTGINIKKLHNVILASPTKSKIRVGQSLGRGLRTHDTKGRLTVFDLADDIQYGDRVNYTYEHFAERVKYYNEEEFDYEIYPVRLKDGS